jgi:hypothetical protein
MPGHFVADCRRRSRTRMATSTSQGRMSSTGRGMTTRASTRASTRTSDDRGRRRAEARPERWLERATSTQFCVLHLELEQ